MRIDGLFTGTLISKGDLIIGSSGKVVGNIEHFGSVLIDGIFVALYNVIDVISFVVGKVVGNINVHTLRLRNSASVHGNIVCKSLSVDPTVRSV